MLEILKFVFSSFWVFVGFLIIITTVFCFLIDFLYFLSVTLKNIFKERKKIIKCPFCKGEIEVGIADEEGNVRDDSYLEDPYSGVSYFPKHEEKDGCPIGTHEGEILGVFLYDTVDDLKRKFEGCD